MANIYPSYAKGIVEAALRGDRIGVDRVLTNAMQSIGEDLVGVIGAYPSADLPLVIASMRIIASSFEGLLSDSGRSMVRNITESASAIVVKSGDIEKLLHREE